ncbi:MAG TPA: GlsB/YeaQ/YmgE family stress response membrane protein [Actinomycetota bacterium]|jgi:uncharacterized membrane protein YeaQ/YmgE (transglycosylase-associated protein family)
MFLILAMLAIAMGTGWVAQIILGRNRQRNDWGQALIAGLIGSFVGGALASLIAGDGFELRPSGIIGSLVGALIVLLVWGAVTGRRTA